MMNDKQDTKWYLDMRFWIGLVIGGVLVTFVGFLPSIILLMQYNLEPNTIEDCKYGLTHEWYGIHCLRESELDKVGFIGSGVSTITPTKIGYYGDGIVDIHGVKVNCNDVNGVIPQQCRDIQYIKSETTQQSNSNVTENQK